MLNLDEMCLETTHSPVYEHIIRLTKIIRKYYRSIFVYTHVTLRDLRAK